MREEKGLNKVGDVIMIGVQVRYQGKESEISYVEIRVVKQDYSKCIKVRLSNAIGDEVRISKRQEFPIVISLQPEYICA
jgi:phosphopantetheinyl transferase (holo-ACP synthase)